MIFLTAWHWFLGHPVVTTDARNFAVPLQNYLYFSAQKSSRHTRIDTDARRFIAVENATSGKVGAGPCARISKGNSPLSHTGFIWAHMATGLAHPIATPLNAAN